jgi:hypothetical protein
MNLFDKFSDASIKKVKEVKNRGRQMRSEKEKSHRGRFMNAKSYLAGTDEKKPFQDRFKEAKQARRAAQ